MSTADAGERLVPLQIEIPLHIAADGYALQRGAVAELLRVRDVPHTTREVRRDRGERRLVKRIPLVARRGEVADALGGHQLDGLLQDAAVLEERLVEIGDVVDDDVAACLREREYAVG